MAGTGHAPCRVTLRSKGQKSQGYQMRCRPRSAGRYDCLDFRVTRQFRPFV